MQKNSYQEKFIILSGMSILYIVSDNNAMVWIGGWSAVILLAHIIWSVSTIYSISQLIQLITNNKLNTMKELTKKHIAQARDIMESFDTSDAMTIGFEQQETYTLTAEQMTIIAAALYLADCEIGE